MWRKTIVTFLFLLLATSFCFAVQLGAGNDRWTLGLAENTDDQLTGSMHLRQRIGDFSINLDYNTITNRGSREYDGTFRSGRADIVDLAVFYGKVFKLNSIPLAINGSLGAGVSVYGNLGSEGVQNIIHKLNGNPSIELPPDDYRVLPLVNLRAGARYSFTDWMGLDMDTSYLFDSTGNQLNALLGARFTYRGLSAVLGVDYTKLWASTWISELYSRQISGLGFDFTLEAGRAVVFSYRMNPANSRSYGVITLDTAGFKPEWEKSLLRFGCSRQYLSDGTDSVGISFEHRVTDILDAGLDIKYTCNYRNDADANNSAYRTRRNYGHWLVGVSLHKDFGYIDPYLDVRAGISHWDIDKLTYLVPEGSDEPERLAEDWYPTVSLQFGLRLLKEGLLVMGPTSIRLNVFCGLDWFPRDLEETLSKDNLHEDWEMTPILYHYGLGFSFGF